MRELCVLVIFSHLISMSTGEKILLVPSHDDALVQIFAIASKALQEDGHRVHLLTTSASPKYDLLYNITQHPTGNFSETLSSHDMKGWFSWHSTLSQKGVKYCRQILDNEDLMRKLTNEKFDLALIDNTDPSRCLYVIPYALKVKYMTLGMKHDPWSARVFYSPSTEGFQGVKMITENSTFFDRLANIFLSGLSSIIFTSIHSDFIARYTSNQPLTTVDQLYHDSEMWLIILDTLCLDYPRMYGQHYQFLGSLGYTPPEPLEGRIRDFLRKKEHGTILVSFGQTRNIPSAIFQKIFAASDTLQQGVIILYEGIIPLDTPTNVLFSKSTAQNSILSHPKTRLLITLGDHRGQTEAVHHGVPMVTIPISDEQKFNGKRSVAHGYGVLLNFASFTLDDLRIAIMEVLENSKYRENIKRCSRISRDMPDPEGVLRFWVNHILKFGGAHLKPIYMDLPLWKFLMLDIVAFFFVLTVTVLVCLQRCCWYFTFRFIHRGWKKGKRAVRSKKKFD